MNALDKFNRDQIIEDIKFNGRDFYQALSIDGNDLELSDPACDVDYLDRVGAFLDEDIESTILGSIMEIEDSRKPHGRWLGDRHPKMRKSRHRYKHFAWDDPNEEEENDGLW
ncbi:MAG: hypothetical protein P1V20_03735 [Verrucomicrobiales bacterium]|nr:hypothetical protein [Verrucomicrobiales bacterium]